MKASDFFRLLSILLVSQVCLTIFLTVWINKRPATMEMSNFKCSCFQSNGDRQQMVFYPDVSFRLPEEDVQKFERNDVKVNITIITNLNETSVLYANGWLESLGRLHIPCRVKVVFEDGVLEPHVKSNIETAVYGDTMTVEFFPIKSEPDPFIFWNQLFQIFLDELLQEHDILYVDVRSIWLNNPLPIIWTNYKSFDMWVAQEADRVKIDTRFVFMKSALLNLRLISEWKMLLNGASAGSTESSKEYFQRSVEKFKITHEFKVRELDFVKFPVRKEYTPEWIRLNRKHALVIYGVNLDGVDFITDDSIPEDAVEKNIIDENGGLPEPVMRKNVTILAATNSAFVDFTRNWLQSLLLLDSRLRVKLLTEDAESFTTLRKVAFHLKNSKVNLTVESDRNSTGKALTFSSKAYLDFVNARPQSVLREMMEGQDVLLVDVDTVWLKDPLPLIWSRYSSYDIFVATGHDQKTPCPCFLYLKNSMLNIKMVNDWFKRLERLNASPLKEKHENDMEALAKILYKYRTRYSLKVHKLSSVQFPTGDLYFKAPIFYDNHKKEVYVVHGNRLGKHDSKLFFFKLLHLWYADNWDYRNSPIVHSD